MAPAPSGRLGVPRAEERLMVGTVGRARGDILKAKVTRPVPARRRPVLLSALAVVAVAYVYIGAGANLSPEPGARASASEAYRAYRAHASAPLVPTAPAALRIAPQPPASAWATVAWVRGRPAAWVARRSQVTLMRVDQNLVHLSLHAGSSDGGPVGWTYGNRVSASEAGLLIAAVNGGFKLTYPNVGFSSGGRVAVALKPGLASIVTYTDGTTDIGAWKGGVPNPGKTVFSVLQNQQLLVDRGVAAATVSDCVIKCWGGTIGLQTVVARSGLGITANGQLVWAAGEHLSPAGLAAALIGAGAVRAIELDINPWWVAGYLYVHRSGRPSPVPLVRGQRGVAGAFLKPYSRDFLTLVAN